jgi:hypothetical protein
MVQLNLGRKELDAAIRLTMLAQGSPIKLGDIDSGTLSTLRVRLTEALQGIQRRAVGQYSEDLVDAVEELMDDGYTVTVEPLTQDGTEAQGAQLTVRKGNTVVARGQHLSGAQRAWERAAPEGRLSTVGEQ